MGNFKPPVEVLWEKYSYNPLTGRFHRILDDYELMGNVVGVNARSHQLSINSCHRYPYGVCVFAWLNGRWPKDGFQIDHINHDPFDHRSWNLREVTRAQNMANRRRAGRLPSPVKPPQFDVSLLPDFLQDAVLSVSVDRSIHHSSTDSLVSCSDAQLAAISEMGWQRPKLGDKVITCYKPATRRRFTPALKFYTSAVLGLKDHAIHVGDIALLWLATVGADSRRPNFYYIAYSLSRVSGCSINLSDGFLSFGSKVTDLPG